MTLALLNSKTFKNSNPIWNYSYELTSLPIMSNFHFCIPKALARSNAVIRSLDIFSHYIFHPSTCGFYRATFHSFIKYAMYSHYLSEAKHEPTICNISIYWNRLTAYFSNHDVMSFLKGLFHPQLHVNLASINFPNSSTIILTLDHNISSFGR